MVEVNGVGGQASWHATLGCAGTSYSTAVNVYTSPVNMGRQHVMLVKWLAGEMARVVTVVLAS